MIKYLDDADLLEEISDFMSRDIFAESLHKDGVVVGVVLLASCEEIRLEKTSEEMSGDDWRGHLGSDSRTPVPGSSLEP